MPHLTNHTRPKNISTSELQTSCALHPSQLSPSTLHAPPPPSPLRGSLHSKPHNAFIISSQSPMPPPSLFRPRPRPSWSTTLTTTFTAPPRKRIRLHGPDPSSSLAPAWRRPYYTAGTSAREDAGEAWEGAHPPSPAAPTWDTQSETPGFGGRRFVELPVLPVDGSHTPTGPSPTHAPPTHPELLRPRGVRAGRATRRELLRWEGDGVMLGVQEPSHLPDGGGRQRAQNRTVGGEDERARERPLVRMSKARAKSEGLRVQKHIVSLGGSDRAHTLYQREKQAQQRWLEERETRGPLEQTDTLVRKPEGGEDSGLRIQKHVRPRGSHVSPRGSDRAFKTYRQKLAQQRFLEERKTGEPLKRTRRVMTTPISKRLGGNRGSAMLKRGIVRKGLRERMHARKTLAGVLEGGARETGEQERHVETAERDRWKPLVYSGSGTAEDAERDRWKPHALSGSSNNGIQTPGTSTSELAKRKAELRQTKKHSFEISEILPESLWSLRRAIIAFNVLNRTRLRLYRRTRRVLHVLDDRLDKSDMLELCSKAESTSQEIWMMCQDFVTAQIMSRLSPTEAAIWSGEKLAKDLGSKIGDAREYIERLLTPESEKKIIMAEQEPRKTQRSMYAGKESLQKMHSPVSSPSHSMALPHPSQSLSPTDAALTQAVREVKRTGFILRQSLKHVRGSLQAVANSPGKSELLRLCFEARISLTETIGLCSSFLEARFIRSHKAAGLIVSPAQAVIAEASASLVWADERLSRWKALAEYLELSVGARAVRSTEFKLRASETFLARVERQLGRMHVSAQRSESFQRLLKIAPSLKQGQTMHRADQVASPVKRAVSRTASEESPAGKRSISRPSNGIGTHKPLPQPRGFSGRGKAVTANDQPLDSLVDGWSTARSRDEIEHHKPVPQPSMIGNRPQSSDTDSEVLRASKEPLVRRLAIKDPLAAQDTVALVEELVRRLTKVEIARYLKEELHMQIPQLVQAQTDSVLSQAKFENGRLVNGSSTIASPESDAPAQSPPSNEPPDVSLLEELFPETLKQTQPTLPDSRQVPKVSSTSSKRGQPTLPDSRQGPKPGSKSSKREPERSLVRNVAASIASDTTPAQASSQAHAAKLQTSAADGNILPGDYSTTVLLLSNASTTLTEADFHRLVPHGAHIPQWSNQKTGGIARIVPGRDPASLERQSHYYLFFSSPGAALAYQRNAARIHKLASMHTQNSVFDAIPPPPGFHEEGEDIDEVVKSYALAVPGLNLHLNVSATPFKSLLASLVREGGYRGVVDKNGHVGRRVLVQLVGRDVGRRGLYNAIRHDGFRRGILWPVSDGLRGVLSLSDIIGFETLAQRKASAGSYGRSVSQSEAMLGDAQVQSESEMAMQATFGVDLSVLQSNDSFGGDLSVWNSNTSLGAGGERGTGPEMQEEHLREGLYALKKKVWGRYVVEFEDEGAAKRFARVWRGVNITGDWVKKGSETSEGKEGVEEQESSREEGRVVHTEVLW
ncbi:hypothetical protein BU16DRAFT_211752 [Lophium mytilinum]|uniref:Uncharacterized protein n=1 Tax=Lophium mytilinum TaxID=390894 RepID=A0A6A6RDT1_9PEZI|nr:hypothetical protein BU16DRAFT_211752 [Lophium mytilinum]